jgi:hypothetical protein
MRCWRRSKGATCVKALKCGEEAKMATKADFMKALDELPDDATIDDAVERLVFMLAVEHGLAQAEAGNLIPHEEIVELVKTWLE